MNARAGFAFQQFVDLSYVWAYNGTALVNTVLRTTDNSTNPVRLWASAISSHWCLAPYQIFWDLTSDKPSRPASLSPFKQQVEVGCRRTQVCGPTYST